MNLFNKIKNQEGSTLVIAIGLSMLVVSIIITLGRQIESAHTMSKEITGENYAYFASETAIETGLYDVIDQLPKTEYCYKSSSYLNAGSCDDKLIDLGNNAQGSVKIVGTTDKKTIKKQMKSVSPFSASLIYEDDGGNKEIMSSFTSFSCVKPDKTDIGENDDKTDIGENDDKTDIGENDDKIFYWQFMAIGENGIIYAIEGIKALETTSVATVEITSSEVASDMYDNINGEDISGFFTKINEGDIVIKKAYFSAKLINEKIEELNCTFESTDAIIANKEIRIEAYGVAGQFQSAVRAKIPIRSASLSSTGMNLN